MVREMIGGCCVCLDERGWNENPLVYCDGSGCSVAVHQACYGIVKVPSGPWFCCKCRSQERVARVKCELCPKKEGALKRTDSGGWAHVVCALYIPEVRFGDVSTMEPIIFSSVPHERFMKMCYICEERNKESKISSGACMSCHKAGCKLAFHVTCAQSKRQLCEEASLNGHVQYVGYCSTHWQRRLKNTPSTVVPIPPPTPEPETEVKKVLKDKKSRSRTESTSSNASIDTNVKLSRGRKPKHLELHNNENKTQENNNNNNNNNINVSTVSDKDNTDEISPARGDEPVFSSLTGVKSKATMPNGQAKQQRGSSNSTSHSFSVNGILNNNEKTNLNSPLNTPVHSSNNAKESGSKSSTDKKIKSPSNNDETEHSESIDTSSKESTKKRKLSEKERLRKKQKLKAEREKEKEKDSKNSSKEKRKKEKIHEATKKKDKEGKSSEKKKKYPQPTQLGLLENGKVSSWDVANPKQKETPDNFQAFLEHQWNQSAQFITSKAQHFDVASLLGCLHQLKSDNMKLEKKLSSLQSRKDRLLGLNARLATSFTEPSSPENGKTKIPLSAMLSKLNESTSPSEKELEKGISPKSKKSKSEPETPEKAFLENDRAVPSPDLAMLAAASAKFDSRMSRLEEGKQISSPMKNNQHLEEKPTIFPHSSVPGVAGGLLQPNVGFGHQPSTSLLNGMLQPNRQSIHTQEYFTNETGQIGQPHSN